MRAKCRYKDAAQNFPILGKNRLIPRLLTLQNRITFLVVFPYTTDPFLSTNAGSKPIGVRKWAGCALNLSRWGMIGVIFRETLLTRQ